MPKIRHLGSSHPSYPSHCRSTASTQDLHPRSLGILGFSGCVRGFSMPKNSYLDNWAPVICTTCPLRWRSAASDSLAQNPNPQRLRRRFFHAQKQAPPRTRAQASTNVLSVTFSIRGLRASQKRSKVLFVAYAMRRKHSWRIRLAAYGARLERVLG